jgi:hypothetical protein
MIADFSMPGLASQRKKGEYGPTGRGNFPFSHPKADYRGFLRKTTQRAGLPRRQKLMPRTFFWVIMMEGNYE